MAEEDENDTGAASDADGDGAKEKTPGGKKKLFIIIGIATVVALGGGGAAFFFLSGGDEVPIAADGKIADEGSEAAEAASENSAGEGAAEGQSASAEATAEKSSGEDDQVSFGETFSFKTFSLNLGNPLENHYVRLDVAVEYRGGEAQKAEIQRRLPQLRDAIVGVVSSKTREFLLSPDGKARLRREILIRLNRYMTRPLEAVYVTDIIIE